MLFNSTIILLTASALSSIQLSRLQLTRCWTLILLFAGVMGTNTLNVSAMGPGVNLYGGIIQVTPLSQTTEIFISVIACVIVGHMWTPVSYIETLKATSTSVTPVETTSNHFSCPRPPATEYSTILVFTTLSTIIYVSSTSLMTLCLSVMLLVCCVAYILISLNSNLGIINTLIRDYVNIETIGCYLILNALYLNTATPRIAYIAVNHQFNFLWVSLIGFVLFYIVY